MVSKDARHHMHVNQAEFGAIAKQRRSEFNEYTQNSKQSDQKVRFDGKEPEFK
jgi:hypothetical protein